jgi:hypothetical protein
VSAGEKMRSLPYIEIKVVPDEPVEVRIRGTAPANVQKLCTFRGFLKVKRRPGELVCELTVNTDLDPKISTDPEFLAANHHAAGQSAYDQGSRPRRSHAI